MKLSQFEFELPEKLIAEYPADQRVAHTTVIVQVHLPAEFHIQTHLL